MFIHYDTTCRNIYNKCTHVLCKISFIIIICLQTYMLPQSETSVIPQITYSTRYPLSVVSETVFAAHYLADTKQDTQKNNFYC